MKNALFWVRSNTEIPVSFAAKEALLRYARLFRGVGHGPGVGHRGEGGEGDASPNQKVGGIMSYVSPPPPNHEGWVVAVMILVAKSIRWHFENVVFLNNKTKL